MVNKDQLEMTPEGKEVVALMEKHFSEEQFQPALTLIEQRYTETQVVWDAGLNNHGNSPFLKTTPAHRLLVFFEDPDRIDEIQAALDQRAVEAAMHARESQAPAMAKPKRKKPVRRVAAKSRKRKPRKPARRKPVARAKRKTKPAKSRRKKR